MSPGMAMVLALSAFLQGGVATAHLLDILQGRGTAWSGAFLVLHTLLAFLPFTARALAELHNRRAGRE